LGKNENVIPKRTPVIADEITRRIDENLSTFFLSIIFALSEVALEWIRLEKRKGSKQEMNILFRWYEHHVLTETNQEECLNFWDKVRQVISSVSDNRKSSSFDFKFNEIRKELGKKITKNDPFLFVFDESSELFDDQINLGSGYERSRRFRDLRRVFSSESGDFPVAVFMGTVSKLSNFAPQMNYDYSSRTKSTGAALFKPFYAINTMDLYRLSDCVKSQSDIASVYLANVVTKGRALFGSLIRAATNQSLLMSCKYVIDLAEDKLCGGLNPSTLYTEINEKKKDGQLEIVAVMSCRFCVSVHGVSRLAEYLVAGHMAMVSFISDDRSSLSIRYGAEGALAEGACKFMNRFSQKSILLDVLFSVVQNCDCDCGRIGELGCRYLFGRAFDHVCHDKTQKDM
jgi:hypothetical protein